MTRQADVIIPVYADVGATRACIDSVLRCAGPGLGRVVIVNDCSPDSAMVPMIEKFRRLHPSLELLSNDANVGFVSSVNRGIGITTRDVVLLNSDTVVTPGWLEEMLEVAYQSDRVAAVAPLSNNGSICSVPEYCRAIAMESLDADLALENLPRSTVVPTGVGFCVLLKRLVLNMIGGFDPAYGRGYNEENDWAMRAQTLGLICLRANRALVYHLGSASFGQARSELDRVTGKLLLSRYPYYVWQVAAFSETPVSRVAAHHVKRRLGRLSACINVRHLKGVKVNGTGVYALELAKALKQHTSFDVSVCGASDEQTTALRELGIETVAAGNLESVQVFHHPAQIFSPADMKLFLSTPSHAVLSYLDLISWRTPSVHESLRDFQQYKAFSFAALQSAQAIIAISEHNRSEIIEAFHLSPERVRTVPLGVDAGAFEKRDGDLNRSRLENLKVRPPYFFSLGSDYAHKNLKLLLTSYAVFRHRFAAMYSDEIPSLVLAGSRSRTLGSLYGLRPESWPVGVSYLGTVSDDEVCALFQDATALVFPTAYEGFGLPVLEAMAAGTPVICSSLTAVPEVAGDAGLYIKDFSIDEIAQHMLSIISSPSLRTKLIESGRRRARLCSWKETALRTAAVYEDVIAHPAADTLFRREMFSKIMQKGMAGITRGEGVDGNDTM